MALTGPNKALERRNGKARQVGLAAGVKVWQGGLAMLASGFARAARPGQGADMAAQAADAATCRVVGIFKHSAEGGVANGDVIAEIEHEGWYLLRNGTSGDAITAADIENDCYVIDDETVGKTHATNTRPKAGRIKDVTPAGVWIAPGHDA